MKAVLQRVLEANVTIDGNMISHINKGLLILLGVEPNDTCLDMEKVVDKIINLRIFSDENDKMNLSLLDIKGEILLVSQFTLMADCKKGRRPSFIGAAKGEFANDMYIKTKDYIENKYNIQCAMGKFGADMKVGLINDGPVTIIIDSKEL